MLVILDMNVSNVFCMIEDAEGRSVNFLAMDALTIFLLSKSFQGEEPLDTGGGRVFSLDASFGLLATASASVLARFLGSALSVCGASCML